MPKKVVKKADQSSTGTVTEQSESKIQTSSTDKEKITHILNLFDIAVEEPQFESLTTSDKCKTSFDSVSANYIKLTHLLVTLDNERNKLVGFLSQIQKQFKQLNANKETISNNEEIKQVVNKALEREGYPQPKIEVKNETKDEINDETENEPKTETETGTDQEIQDNDNEKNGDENKKKPAPKKKVITKRIVKKTTQNKGEPKESENEGKQDKQEESQLGKPKVSKKIVVKAKKPKAKEPDEEKEEPIEIEDNKDEKTKRIVKKKTA